MFQECQRQLWVHQGMWIWAEGYQRKRVRWSRVGSAACRWKLKSKRIMPTQLCPSPPGRPQEECTASLGSCRTRKARCIWWRSAKPTSQEHHRTPGYKLKRFSMSSHHRDHGVDPTLLQWAPEQHKSSHYNLCQWGNQRPGNWQVSQAV